jgi:hypothetical protein
MDMVDLRIEERISPRILTNLMQNFRNAAEAIFEIVDNSVDAADLEGRRLRIEIEWTPERIVVTDRGGRGMSLDGLRSFFRWGESGKAEIEGALGRFGQGGKAAMGYLARSFTITAKAAGEAHGYRIGDRDYRDRAHGTKSYRAEQVALDVPLDEGYVQIRLTNLNRRRIDAKALGGRIADVYGELIAAGRCTIVLNGQELAPLPLPLEDPRTAIDLALPGGKAVTGWFGRLEPDVAKKGRLRGGLRLCVHGRLICDGEFFGHRGPWFKQSLNQLIGVLELAAVPVNMNKTDFDRDSETWAVVQAHLHDQIAPLVRELSGARELERVSRSDWRRVRQAQQMVERALVQLELDELLPPAERGKRRRRPRPTASPETLRALSSAAAAAVPDSAWPDRSSWGAEHEGSPDRLTVSMGLEAPAESSTPDPRAPSLGPAVASDEPTAAAAEPRAPSLSSRVSRQRVHWEPRLLTEDRRSDWEEIDGHRILLINTRFPLYRESKGDVWYVVETGVFELTRRIRAGELTVDEYYDEVNRILQQASEVADDVDEVEATEVVAAAS